jgi:hypothetical protein
MDTIIFKIDKKLKEKAQKQAKKGGFSLTDYYRNVTVPLAEGKVTMGVIPQKEEKFNAKTAREMRQALKDIKEGKNLSPAFKTIEEMKKYLMS